MYRVIQSRDGRVSVSDYATRAEARAVYIKAVRESGYFSVSLVEIEKRRSTIRLQLYGIMVGVPVLILVLSFLFGGR